MMTLYPVSAGTEVSVPLESRHLVALFDTRRLKRGTPPWAQVRLEATVRWKHFGRSYELKGHLARLGARIDPATRTLTATIELPGPETRAEKHGVRGLLPGTFVQVAIRGRTFRDVLVLPAQVFESRNSLRIVREGRFHTVSIDPIVTLGGDVIVRADGALPPGSKVVVTEVPGAIDGAPVRIFPLRG
jgi:multidrug efflux pump subunit AcrA (membrane-fusion protein)